MSSISKDRRKASYLTFRNMKFCQLNCIVLAVFVLVALVGGVMDSFVSWLFRWRHTFRAFLGKKGNCSEPITSEAIVLCPRPGGEAREDERIARSRIEVSVRAVQKLKDNPKIKCNLWQRRLREYDTLIP